MLDLKFRSSFWATFWINIATNFYFFIITPLLFLWVDSVGNLKYSVIATSTAISAIFLTAFFVFSIYVSSVIKITVKSTGIHGYNYRGNYSFVAWNEIESIEPYRYFGCKYLRLFFANSTTPLWIPLFLVQQNKFNQAVIDRTEATNPLHIALLDTDKLFKNVPFHGKPKNKLRINNQQQPTDKNNLLKLNTVSAKSDSNTPPWMHQEIFPTPSEPDTYGYCIGKKLHTCSRPSLIENVKSDSKKLINLVWTPETPYLLPPEEISWLGDALQAREKRHFKKLLQTDLMNCLVWGGILWMNWTNSSESVAIRQIMLFNWLAIAVIPTIEHGWGLYRSRIKTSQDLVVRSQENRYGAWIKNIAAPWTNAIVAGISLVAIVQVIVFFMPQIDSSILTAGIVKSAVWEGEAWRLLTGTLLHGNIIHFMFNIIALFVLSKLIEVTTHRLYIPLVFLVSALCGSLFSLIFIPDATSVGASGGIMGLLGFLLILSRKHKHSFPVAYQQMLAKATIYTFLAGLLAYQVIDNPAHLGGFLAGALLGWQLIPHRKFTIPMKEVPHLVTIMGKGSVVVIAIAILFTIYKMLVI